MYLSFKRQVLYTILFLLNSIYVFKEFNISIVFIILIFIIIYYFIGKIMWDKENKSYFDSYYKDFKISRFKECVCNIPKFDGPTFGILKFEDERIIFHPFKENLKSEAFCINYSDVYFMKYKKVPLIKNIFMKDYLSTVRIKYLDKKIDIDIPKNFKLLNQYI